MIISNDTLKSHVAANRAVILEQLKEFIAFKSVSADTAYDSDCVSCATWLKGYLTTTVGLTHAEIIPTSHHPLVYAEKIIPGAKRTVLIYGHYDVQPVENQSGWTVSPFAGHERDGAIVARGAVDNKGQTLYVLKALEYLIKEQKLNVSVKVLIEGEEENGSGGLAGVLDAIKDKIAADTLLVADGGSPYPEMVALSMSLRGLVAINATIKGPAVDCHSGVFGGIVPNPAQGLAALVASLHDKNGKVAVEGFYDAVIEPTRQEVESAGQAAGEILGIAKALNIALEGGEKGIPPEIRRSFRPTLEINGMCSGYNGPGSKTIIPSDGILKITCRTVAKQDPSTVGALVLAHLKKHCPSPFVLEAQVDHGGDWMKASLTDRSSLIAIKAGEVVYGKAPPIIWEGASIPILPAIAKAAKSEVVMIGLCTVHNGMHSPDENFSFAQFEAGFLYSAQFLSMIGD